MAFELLVASWWYYVGKPRSYNLAICYQFCLLVPSPTACFILAVQGVSSDPYCVCICVLLPLSTPQSLSYSSGPVSTNKISS